MKRYKKYRLAFDATGLFGLLLLALYCWFGHPAPKWCIPLGFANVSALGFSADNQKVYTIKDIRGIGNSPPKPVLQRWELATGTLEAEYPLQVPADDLSMMKPDLAALAAGGLSFNYRVHHIQDNILYVETSLGIRFYDVQSGECLTRKNMPRGWIYYMLKNPADHHHWGIDGSRNESGKAVLFDLTTGDVLHTLERDSAQSLYHSRVSSDQKYLLLLWEVRKENKGLPNYELEIVEMGTWKSVLKQATNTPGGCDGVGHLLKQNLFIQTSELELIGYSMNRLDCFRADLSRGTLEPDYSHALNGFASEDMIFGRNSFLVQHGLRGKHQPILPKWKALWNSIENLIRNGTFPDVAGQQDYHVYDFNTGLQLRQLTGLTAFGHQALYLSHDARFLIGVEYTGDSTNAKAPYQKFLSLYEIPTYWWERSWSAALYLALVLIFLWPARFLGRKPV